MLNALSARRRATRLRRVHSTILTVVFLLFFMKYSPLYAVLLGLLYYPLQQLIFFWRFGRFNTIFSVNDLLLPLVGIFAFLLLFSFLKRTEQKNGRMLLWILFILLAIPLSLIGSVGGGLLGPLGIVIFGLVPVLIVLAIGKGIARLVWGK